ncbi:hypothetical protein J4Q44_G00106720 [Coregonus suidteri]|uniref:SMB domain-containing protein n=1 Tax=Coregonus suidteri TaxID=861788 RepID=A0AAN8R0G4_9TELE
MPQFSYTVTGRWIYSCVVLLVFLLVPSEAGCQDTGFCCTGHDRSCVSKGWRADRSYGTCYCDQACTSTLDCCHDYELACPAVSCVEDAGCAEYRNHHRQCSKSLVPALITTGDYGNARKKRDIPDNDDVQGYCVQFQLTSLTPGCQRSVGPHTRWMQYLKEGHQVCVECQPPALAAGQTHCSGDGDKDEEESGRQSLQWQAVGNPRCRGVWRRVGRLDSCSCPTIHSFGQTGQHMDQA